MPSTTVQPIRKGRPSLRSGRGRRGRRRPDCRQPLGQHPQGLPGSAGAARCRVGGGTLNDEALAAYIGTLETDGRSPASAATAVAAAKFRARFNQQPSPAGRLTEAALKGMRRRAARKPRPRGQATGITLAEAQTMLAVAPNPRPRGRGGQESRGQAVRRGQVDAAIVALLFQAGLRRSEAARLTWGDIRDAEDSDGILIDVRFSKSNQEGDADVRFVKGRFRSSDPEVTHPNATDATRPGSWSWACRRSRSAGGFPRARRRPAWRDGIPPTPAGSG